MWLGEAQADAWRKAKAQLLLPIVYVRGFAMTGGEIEDTSADPFNGFNVGSMLLRTGWTGDAARHPFESPVLRLSQPPYGYRVVFSDGIRGLDAETRARVEDWRSTATHRAQAVGEAAAPSLMAIYRYYDTASRAFGDGVRPGMETYAWGLGKLISDIIDTTRAPGVYIVAHSMGGLVSRTFLQNKTVLDGSSGPRELRDRCRPISNLLATAGELALSQVQWDRARGAVQRLFTYGTPHNGISVQGGLGNALLGPVDSLLGLELENFDRKRMHVYLGGPPTANSLDDRFPLESVFTLVGTASGDYPAAGGFSRRLVGQVSDGLVELDNAVVQAPVPGGTALAARAYVRRAHSGPYGMVNSEEGFGNLSRFLFGDIRVEGSLVVRDIKLPEGLEKLRHETKAAGMDPGIRASYAFEVFLRVRGARWALTERLARDGSAVFRTYDDLFGPRAEAPHRHIGLFDAFLDSGFRTLNGALEEVEGGQTRLGNTLGFALRLRAAVPDYEVKGRFWQRTHYEGSTLVDQDLVFLAFPDPTLPGGWNLAWGTNPADSRSMRVIREAVDTEPEAVGDIAVRWARGDRLEFWIPVVDDRPPGFRAWLRLVARPWNAGGKELS